MQRYDLQFLRHLVDYIIWADRAALSAAGGVADQEYYKKRDFSFGSIHNLLVHMMVAQKTWLSRWNGIPVLGRLENETEHPTREALQERWPIVHSGYLNFLTKQSNESLNTVMTVQRTDGQYITLPLGAMLMHAIDHANYHRGQFASMMKQAGVQKTPYNPYLFFAMQESKS